MRRFLLLAALPLAAQTPGMDVQNGNPADARMVLLMNTKQWKALADHLEAISPKDRDRNLTALHRAERWARLVEECPPVVERLSKDAANPPIMARQYLALAYTRLGQLPEAVAIYLAAGSPRDLENALGTAWTSKDYPFLLQTAERVLALNPSMPEAGALKGEWLAKLGRFGEAEPFLLEATVRLPNRPTSWSDPSRCQQERGAAEEAMASAGKALELDPKLIEAWYNRSRSLIALKRYPEAREDLAAGLALDPTPETRANPETILGQVDRYLEGQARKADREAQKAAEVSARKGRKRKKSPSFTPCPPFASMAPCGHFIRSHP